MKKLLVLAALFFSINAEATNYFRWGWEDTRPSWGINGRATSAGQYDTGTPAGASSARDCTVAHTGSCSMKLVVVGNDGNNQPLGFDGITTLPAYGVNFIGSQAMYYRWWMRIDTGFVWPNAGSKLKSSRITGTAGAPTRLYTGYLYQNAFGLAECDVSAPNVQDGCTLNDGTKATDGTLNISHTFAIDSQWHEYVVMVKPNTSAACVAPTNCDAEFRVWVDNVAVGSYLNFKLLGLATATDFREALTAGWMVRPYFQFGSGAGGGTIYIDDVSVDNAYNSMIALPIPTNPQVSDLGDFMRRSIASYTTVVQLR